MNKLLLILVLVSGLFIAREAFATDYTWSPNGDVWGSDGSTYTWSPNGDVWSN